MDEADAEATVMATVAAEQGRSLQAVGHDPYALTLWSFALLERKRSLERRAERFDLASLVRLAVLDGEAFVHEARAFQRELAPVAATRPAYPTGPSQAEIVAHYDAALKGVTRWRDAAGNPVDVVI